VTDQAIDVRVAGEIDIANVDEFRAVLWGQPAQPATLRVDLSEVAVLSAAGVRALVAVHLHRRARGGQLVLSNPTATVRRELRATRVNRVIPIVGTTASTLAADPRPVWPRHGPRTPGTGSAGGDAEAFARPPPDVPRVAPATVLGDVVATARRADPRRIRGSHLA
jgi:anti-anti-sigma factor